MAQRQYTPASKGRGFNSITVSNANIAKLEAEGNRIIQGMQARRDADLENKRQILQDMKEDANYYDKVRQRDFKIADTNLENQQRQLQFNEAERFRRYQESTQGAAKIFGDLANLSFTAAKQANELKKEEEAKQFESAKQEGIARAGMFRSEDIPFLAKLNEQNRLSDLLDNDAALAKARGMDPNAIAKLRNKTAKQRSGFLVGQITQDTRANYGSFYIKQLTDPNKFIKDPVSGRDIPYAETQDKPELLAMVQNNISTDWINKREYPKNQDFLRAAYGEIAKIHSAGLLVANTTQTKNLNDDTLLMWRNNAFSDWDQYGGAAFRMHRSILGNEGAHLFQKTASTTMNPDGTYVLTDEQWKGTDIYGDDPSKFGRYELDHKQKTLEIQNARRDKQTEWIVNQERTDKAKYLRESRDAWALYQQEPTRETLAAIEEGFSDNPEGLPDWVIKAKNKLDPANAPYKQQLILTAKDAKERGMLTQELITEIYSFDPKFGNELQASFDAQNPVVNNPNFKAQLKAVQGFVKKPSTSVPFPIDSNDSVRASRILGTELERDTIKLAAKYGGSAQAIIQASDEAAAALQVKIIADSTNPQGRYYRVYNPVTGLFSFPNLSDAPISQTQRSREQSRQFAEAIQSGRQQKLINTKFGVLTESELISEVKRISRPGYVPNMKLVMASKGVEGGLVAVLNKQIKLSGIPGLKPIQPPESLQRTGAYSPAAQRHLSRHLNADVSTRVHGVEGAKLSFEWNRHLVPAQYRESIETHAKTYGVPAALISATLEVESSWGTNPTSPAGAKGIAQFDDGTARDYGVNVYDDNSSIKGAANYLNVLLKRFNNDPFIASGAYNAGPNRMKEYLENGRPLPAETINHMRKIAKAYYKYSGDSRVLSNPHASRSGSSFQVANVAATYVGMDTSAGPDAGKNACVWALNKVMRAAGMNVPWGNSVYVPFVKGVLDKTAKRVASPVPGAIAVMQDNHPTAPYPHIGIVGADGMIVSNSSSRRRFDWRGTPQEYEQKYGRPNLYYVLN